MLLVAAQGDLVEIRSLVVAPAYRRKGIGRFIVHELLEQSKGKNVCLLTIEPRVSFYEKIGFKVVEVQVTTQGAGEVPHSRTQTL